MPQAYDASISRVGIEGKVPNGDQPVSVCWQAGQPARRNRRSATASQCGAV